MSTVINSDKDTSQDTSSSSKNGYKGRIAVDMDDVLCSTNAAVVTMHNEMFKTEPPLTLDDFQNYLYWLNRGWGTPVETVQMVSQLYDAGLYAKAPPIPGAKEALLKLKEMGYSLVIITARSESQREGTEDWVAEFMPDIFDEIHFTGAFQHLYQTKEEREGHVAKRAVISHKKRSKAEVVHETNSLFLIDDSAENALDASLADPPAKVLLFGNYPWNAVIKPRKGSQGGEDVDEEEGLKLDEMPYVEKVERGLLEKSRERRKRLIEKDWLPEGLERVADWQAVIRWVGEDERKR